MSQSSGDSSKKASGSTDTPEELKERVFGILSSNKNAISEEELSMRMNNVDKMLRLKALNSLIIENRIKPIQGKVQGEMLYEIVVEEQNPEDAIFEIIKESDKNGIWTRDIRMKSKLSQLIVNKCLKTLEQKKLIKTVKTITNRKLYILFNLEPDESVTGGACYDSGVLLDVLKNLKEACFQFVFERYETAFKELIEDAEHIGEDVVDFDRIYCSSSEILEEFRKKNLFKDVKINELEHILDILVYESKLSKKKIGPRKLFRFNSYHRIKSDLFYSPCTVCHLYNDCLPASVNISPENCDYLSVDKF